MASLRPGDVVLLVGLKEASSYNYAAATVLDETLDDDRFAVKTVRGAPKRLAVRRRNLVKAESDDDRERLFARVAWARQLEVRCARPWLEARLPEELQLRVAGFFAPRETMALTSGFADGEVVPEWSVHEPGRGWRAVHCPAWRIFGAERVPDGVTRIDCAVVDVGSGRFLVAGGCGDHPARSRRFFDSAFVFDSVALTARALPNMPHPRHGCSGARIGRKVYIVGGDYVMDFEAAEGHFCDVFDLDTETWSELLPQNAPEGRARFRSSSGWVHPATASAMGPARREELFNNVAFQPVGAVAGRLCVIVRGRLLAWNPRDPRGWRFTSVDVSSSVGTAAQGSCVSRRAGSGIVGATRRRRDDDAATTPR